MTPTPPTITTRVAPAAPVSNGHAARRATAGSVAITAAASLLLMGVAWLLGGMLRTPQRFLHPEALYALVLLPWLWFLWLRPVRRPVVIFSDLATLRAAGARPHGYPRLLLPFLRTAALVALIVAAARPQRADESSQTFVEGIAIQMVVDASSSMNDHDLSPPGQRWTRFEVVKEVFRRFVFGDGKALLGRPNDLIGIVKFAKYADSICPLTLDHDSLGAVLDTLRTVMPRSEDDGTAIGEGLGLAVARLVDLKRTTGSGQQFVIKSRVAIVLTDGENNAGIVRPQEAGELAARNGIKVYTILAGTGQQVMFGGRLPVNDTDMRKIAELTGGKFYRADDRDSLMAIYQEIDQLERTKAEERRFVEWGELAPPWLLAGLLAAAAGVLLEATRLRKIP
jgi:Ca-activated chloride channel family protein